MKHVPSERPSMMKGCEFELTYRENPNVYKTRNILKDVWYKAIIETNPNSKLYVRLLKDDFSTPLSELTKNGALFRPIQPKCLKYRLSIKISSIVEADYKNAWWTGFVVKEIDDDKCLVCFDSLLSDIILFQRKHLRPHLDWLDQRTYTCWVLTSKQNDEFLRRLAQEPMFSLGTMVEVNTKFSEVEDFWVPCMIIKEIKDDGDDEYKYVVKVCNEYSKKTPNKSVGLCSHRPRPSPFEVQEYQLEEVVEAYNATGWLQARVLANEGRIMGSDSRKWCLVRFEAKKKEVLIKKSDLRPLNVWEHGIWKYDNRITSLLRLHCSFAELEKHGFDVTVPQARISKLFSLRDSKAKKMDELEGIKKVTAEKMSLKVENQRKILELQRMNEELDKEIAQSKSCSVKIVQQLEDVELQFQTTASAQW